MKWKNIIIKALILIILCVSSFFIGIKYESNQKLNQDRKYYLNHIYHEIDNTIQLLSSVGDWGSSINKTDVTVNPYRQLLTNINTIKVISDQSFIYVAGDKDIGVLSNLADSFSLIGNGIGGGISYNNQTLCDDFLKDGILSETEILFLTSLKEDLRTIKSGLYSENTKQENPNMTFAGLNEIVKAFTTKYAISNLPNIGFKN